MQLVQDTEEPALTRWLPGSSVIRQSERSLVRFPVRARAWAMSSVPSRHAYKR